jgi:hypothetical protein
MRKGKGSYHVFPTHPLGRSLLLKSQVKHGAMAIPRDRHVGIFAPKLRAEMLTFISVIDENRPVIPLIKQLPSL